MFTSFIIDGSLRYWEFTFHAKRVLVWQKCAACVLFQGNLQLKTGFCTKWGDGLGQSVNELAWHAMTIMHNYYCVLWGTASVCFCAVPLSQGFMVRYLRLAFRWLARTFFLSFFRMSLVMAMAYVMWGFGWALWDSNLRSPACKAGALNR